MALALSVPSPTKGKVGRGGPHDDQAGTGGGARRPTGTFAELDLPLSYSVPQAPTESPRVSPRPRSLV